MGVDLPGAAAAKPGDDDIVVPELEDVEFNIGSVGYYNDSYPARMRELAQLGLTIVALATAFGVAQRTLVNWLDKHPRFRRAYEEGKDIHDYSVQASLLMRAQGFSYVEKKHYEGVDTLGRSYNYTVTSEKYVPPDVTAQIFWLKNRHRGEWADVHRAEFSAKVGMDITKTMKLEMLSAEEREFLKGIAIKQISDMHGTTGD